MFPVSHRNSHERSALSGDALAALHDFYLERDERKRRFEEMKAEVEASTFHAPLSMEMFSEDWNASQFWVHAHCLLCCAHSNRFSTAMRQRFYWHKSFFTMPIEKLELPSFLLRVSLSN